MVRSSEAGRLQCRVVHRRCHFVCLVVLSLQFSTKYYTILCKIRLSATATGKIKSAYLLTYSDLIVIVVLHSSSGHRSTLCSINDSLQASSVSLCYFCELLFVVNENENTHKHAHTRTKTRTKTIW